MRNDGDGVSTPTAAQTGPGDAQPRELIVTIYGLYARAEHNWLSVASLVRLMADLGVDGPAVRSSVSRLKRRDTLRSLRLDGAAGYALSPSSLEVLREGDARIFDRRRATREDGWVLVVFSVPERERDKRHELRTWLTRLGFGTAAPGVWVAPGIVADETWEVLTRRGLDTYADMFRGAHLAFADLRGKVGQWWDLDELSAQYAQFIGHFRPLAKRWARKPMPARDAFVEYIPMLTSWRRLPYLDPGLPLDLLPGRWNGVTAGDLFAELNLQLADPARRYALSVVHR
jgi:phenylacetic acid degradation operon negative regulatory protein